MGIIYRYKFLAFTGWMLFGLMFIFFLCKPQTIVKENVVKTVAVYKEGKGYSQRQNFILDCVKNAAKYELKMID